MSVIPISPWRAKKGIGYMRVRMLMGNHVLTKMQRMMSDDNVRECAPILEPDCHRTTKHVQREYQEKRPQSNRIMSR